MIVITTSKEKMKSTKPRRSDCAEALDFALSHSRITYRQISDSTDIDPGSLSNFKNGKKEITTATLSDIVRAMPIKARLTFALTFALGEDGFLQHGAPVVGRISDGYEKSLSAN